MYRNPPTVKNTASIAILAAARPPYTTSAACTGVQGRFHTRKSSWTETDCRFVTRSCTRLCNAPPFGVVQHLLPLLQHSPPDLRVILCEQHELLVLL